MAEYIKRDAAIAAIKGNCWDAHTPVEAVKSVPAVDAVPVVRCKDCEHYSGSSGVCNLYLHFSIAVNPDDFCSHGERRTT